MAEKQSDDNNVFAIFDWVLQHISNLMITFKPDDVSDESSIYRNSNNITLFKHGKSILNIINPASLLDFAKYKNITKLAIDCGDSHNNSEINLFHNIPLNLKSLELIYNNFTNEYTYLMILPITLDKLHIENTSLHVNVNYLPSLLTDIHLSVMDGDGDYYENIIIEYDYLPPYIEKLSLYNMHIKSLNYLPAFIIDLTLSEIQLLHDISNLPNTIEKLSIYNCNDLIYINKVPYNLKYLKICHATHMQLRYINISNCDTTKLKMDFPKKHKFEIITS